MNEYIDEENIEQIIPNYADLSEEGKKEALEFIYKRQKCHKYTNKELEDVLERQKNVKGVIK